MCKLKSGIILKNRVFVPEYDSHEKMLKELGIEDSYLNASKTFVRVELSPENGEMFSDIDTWKLKTDQDVLPDWWDEKTYKPQVVEAVKEWAKTHIHINQDNLIIDQGINHCIKDCNNVYISGSVTVEEISGSTTVEYICDSAIVKYIYDSVIVKHIYGFATIESISGSATVKNISGSVRVENICGFAKVENIYDCATVESICDGAIVENIYHFATVISAPWMKWKNKNMMHIDGNATFKDRSAKTIYQAGDWKFVKVDGQIKKYFKKLRRLKYASRIQKY